MHRQHLAPTLFIMPACALIGAFVFLPAARMVHTSVRYQSLTAPETGPFAGTDNHRAVCADPDFRQAAANTAWFTVMVVPLQTVLALLLALWVNGPCWSWRALRLAVFVPTTISLAVLSVLWKLLYEPVGATGAGLFNGFITTIGLDPQPFLTSPRQALPCIAAMSIWQGVGFQMMIVLAGLQTIPRQLHEAAALDGARRWGSFWHITLPGLAPSLLLVVMITTIFALKLFVQPYLMTDGGPLNSTTSVVQYVYRAAFVQRDMGLACAAGTIFFVAVTVVAVLQRHSLRRAET